jgi:hypothetical protein
MGREERGEAMMTKEQIIAGIIDCLDHQLCSAMGHMQDKYYKAIPSPKMRRWPVVV